MRMWCPSPEGRAKLSPGSTAKFRKMRVMGVRVISGSYRKTLLRRSKNESLLALPL